MNRNLLLIHGAWCSRHSFSYIKKKVLDDSRVGHISCFEYDCQTEELGSILERAENHLHALSRKNDLETVIVGHSMGGLIALALSQQNCVHRTITMAAPLSGIRYSQWLSAILIWHSPILKHLHPRSHFINNLQAQPYLANPIDVLVATKGFNPMIHETSDGVITLDTQTRWVPEGCKVIEVPVNHNEILQSPHAILAVEKALSDKYPTKQPILRIEDFTT